MASSSSSPSYPNDSIDLPELFDSSPLPSHASSSSSAVAASIASSSSSSSSPSAAQQITLSSVPYDVKLLLNDEGQSELCFETAIQDQLSSSPESWRFGGSAHIGAKTYCSCFSADSKYLITGSGSLDFNVRIWDPATKTLVATLSGHKSYVCSVISFHLNGKMLLVSGSWDSTIRIWEWADSADAAAAAAFSPPLCVAILQAKDYVNTLAYCSQRSILISGQYDETIKFWSAPNWQCIQTVRSSAYSRPCAFSLSCDASKLASGLQNGSIELWDLSSYTEIKRWKAATNSIAANGLCFSPSHPDILVTVSYDETCSTWNCATGTKIGSISSGSSSSSGVSPVSFPPNDGSYFVTVSNANQLILVDSKTSNLIKIMDGSPSVKYLSSACFSPDGKYLACATQFYGTSWYIWESSASSSVAAAVSANEIAARAVVPESALDFRLVSLSESTCLVVARLVSGAWAVAMATHASADSSKSMISINEWTLIPNSMTHPIVRLLPLDDGITIKIEDNNSSDSHSIV